MIGQVLACLRLYSTARKGFFLILLALSFNGEMLCISGRTGPISGKLLPYSLPQQSAGSQATDQEMGSLTPGPPVDNEISGEQIHRYSLILALHQYACLDLQQDGIDIVARLFGPDDKLIKEVDNESRIRGQERLELVAHAPGSYRIELKPKYKFTPSGRYQLRVAELRVATDRDDSLDEARRLHYQAQLFYFDDKYQEALQTEQQALKMRQEILGPDNPEVANSLLNVGLYYRHLGEIREAEDAYLRALAIREKSLGPDHPAVSFVLHNLGYLYYYDLRDYTRAQTMYERSLAIKQKALGPEHPLVAMTLGNMGLLQWKNRDYGRAEAYYQRALEIIRKNEGDESSDVANYILNLGIVYKESGDYARGEACYRKALAIWEKTEGKGHPEVSIALESLGILFRDKGDYQTAEPFLQRAIDIEVTEEGADHPDVANTLVILARLYEAKGDMARAVEYQSRAAAIEEKNIATNLSLGSERQKLSYFSSLAKEADRRISLHVRSAPTDPGARDLALTMVLQRKGRVLDALADTSASLRRGLNSQDQALLDKLNDTTARLARLVLEGRLGESAADHENAVKALEAQRDQLEEDLSRRSAGVYQPSRPATIEAIRNLISEDAALIEFAVYHPSDPRVPIERDIPAELRYVAYIIRNRSEVEWRDLGPAKDIDSAIDAFREALADPRRHDVARLARALDGRVLQPLRSSLGQARQLLVSPDGRLNLVPFAALVDESGHYLLERYSFTYLTSGRDLLRSRMQRQSKSPPVVIADPAYGSPALLAATDKPGAGDSSHGVEPRVDFSQVFFTPLPGATEEVRALKAILPQATFFTREQATKAVINKLNGPAILHIATHGFFLQDGTQIAAEDRNREVGKDHTRLNKWIAHVDNPLLRSGLALAGANHSSDGNTDGILTALEVAALDLWGTKLVVLSACDTGVGDVRNGEGVYGLRRALVLAGSESQIMSLWAVSDLSTRDLIIAYYKAVMQGVGRGEALRQAQLQMLKDSRRRHPYYWAGFIQSGEWGNLEGTR
jgi:CHAT domain-containing protein